MKTMTITEFRQTLKDQGVPREHYAFRCPTCRTVQSAADLIAAGAGADFDAVQPYLAFSCVGRFTGAGSPSDNPPGTGCNWTLGGFFLAHQLEVIDDEGKHHPRFEPVSAEEAQAHLQAKS
jgi:hypothetical protein